MWRYVGGLLPCSLAVSCSRRDLDAISRWWCIFEGRFGEPNEVVDRAGRLLGDFLVCIGVVARDDCFGSYRPRQILGAESRLMAGLFSSHVGECLAVREGVWLALSCGFSKYIVETDALNVLKHFTLQFNVLLKQMSLKTFAILVYK
ncbi:hypothetical protein TIFTF001_025023 [Ficus carica]|uniref:RNase H type-1 domain-containing protein n=1 Tax=Ficus carica TaxID=3494 RepID=A0AA88AI05_FICCA|nr:hypothetical protein TIFTF001_025023 [Ficus carica]